jgi:outer membrane protein assembly factor BamD (BamD/ComL family)
MRPLLLKVAVLGLLLKSIGFAEVLRATPVYEAAIHVSPDRNSAKLAEVARGRELVIIEMSGDWVNVEATLTEEKVVTGWVRDKGIVRATTPGGDKILFGEAVDSEEQASRSHGRNGAAQDAMRLYYRTAEYFPSSPLAGEAMYRSADIRWQIEKADVMSRPSAREQDAYLREGMEEKYMKEVMKKFPGSRWADLAAFHLIDNKLCGDWQAQSKCPEKEADIYEKYANEHPQSPNLAQALFEAAYRRSALIEIYKSEDQGKKAAESRTKAVALAQRIVAQSPQSDWGARAQRLLYLMEQQIPTYGNNAME